MYAARERLSQTRRRALAAEVIAFAGDLRAAGVLAHAPGAAGLAAALKSATSGITKVKRTRGQGAAELATVKTKFTAAQRAACELKLADCVVRADAAAPQWQRSITFGLIEDAGLDALVLGWAPR